MSLSALGRLSLMQRAMNARLSAVSKTVVVSRRNMGSGIGDYPGGIPQSMKAKLFEGHPTNEGWEMDAAITSGLAIIMMTLAIFYKPDVSVETWAHEEAQARLELKAQGFDKFEFGKHYNTVKVSNQAAEWEKFTNKSIQPGEDDDDDDDEEEEEEEEEDDE